MKVYVAIVKDENNDDERVSVYLTREKLVCTEHQLLLEQISDMGAEDQESYLPIIDAVNSAFVNWNNHDINGERTEFACGITVSFYERELN
jgi:hypothetical protein